MIYDKIEEEFGDLATSIDDDRAEEEKPTRR